MTAESTTESLEFLSAVLLVSEQPEELVSF